MRMCVRARCHCHIMRNHLWAAVSQGRLLIGAQSVDDVSNYRWFTLRTWSSAISLPVSLALMRFCPSLSSLHPFHPPTPPLFLSYPLPNLNSHSCIIFMNCIAACFLSELGLNKCVEIKQSLLHPLHNLQRTFQCPVLDRWAFCYFYQHNINLIFELITQLSCGLRSSLGQTHFKQFTFFIFETEVQPYEERFWHCQWCIWPRETRFGSSVEQMTGLP